MRLTKLIGTGDGSLLVNWLFQPLPFLNEAEIAKNQKKVDRARGRTWNLLIRSQAPCHSGFALEF